MLRVKSFEIMQDEEINKLLTEYRLAQGSSVFISEGKVCIPYEDGEAPNAAQKTIFFKEQMHGMEMQRELLIHSQMVNEATLAGVREQLEKARNEVTAPGTKESYDKRKEIEEEIKRLENVESQTATIITNNAAEITRMDVNIEMFNKRISELNS